MENILFYGDNLIVLREHIKDESIDLIYLDPPFNSKRVYNVLFKNPKGHESEAQVTAFEDSWHWGDQAEMEFAEILKNKNSHVAQALSSFREILSDSDLMAYLTMMTNRLLELHRVLKDTGSIYLHCDPTASHYLKIMMDTIFLPINFRNEIIWRRAGSHNSSNRFGPIHDVLLFYSKSNNYYFKKIFKPYLLGHVEGYFKNIDERGHFWTNSLTGSGIRNGESGSIWHGYNPTVVGRHWAIPGKIIDELGIDTNLSIHEKLDALDEFGFIGHPGQESLAMPTYHQYLEASKGLPLQDIWSYQPHTQGVLYNSDECIDEDVKWLTSQGSKERLGYPTQKPQGLLLRIIESSCPENGIVLDPFCGCGTAVHASQLLKRPWLGIDITHLAIGLIERRLKDAFPNITFRVHGTPTDIDGARNLALRDKYEFQYWACDLVNAIPAQNKKKGADFGIDGTIYFQDEKSKAKKIIVSVKGGENIARNMIADLKNSVDRENAQIGLFVTLNKPTDPMLKEALSGGYYESPIGKSYPKIQILTIEELLSGSKTAQYPDLARGGLSFRKASAENEKGQQLELL